MICDYTGRTLIYDAFIRDGVCYMVSTYLHYKELPMQVKVGGVVAEEIGYNEYEPVRYFRVPVSSIPLAVDINGVSYNFNEALDVLPSITAPSGFAIATLFKDDHTHVGEMIDWYRAHGFEHFYLYYNGAELPLGLPTGPGITYRMWDYTYRNNNAQWNDKNAGWSHAAQVAFLTTARLRYLPEHEWTGLVDVDECVWPIDGKRMCDVLARVSASNDVVKVRNYWAFRSHDCIIHTMKSEGDWFQRTKCFYRGRYTGLCGIHYPKGRQYTCMNHEGMMMLHIVNCGHMERMDKIILPRGKVPLPLTKS